MCVRNAQLCVPAKTGGCYSVDSLLIIFFVAEQLTEPEACHLSTLGMH